MKRIHFLLAISCFFVTMSLFSEKKRFVGSTKFPFVKASGKKTLTPQEKQLNKETRTQNKNMKKGQLLMAMRDKVVRFGM